MSDINKWIQEIKIKYGEIYIINIEEDEYVFRLLTRKEYSEIIFLYEDPDVIAQEVCKKCLLSPEITDFYNIGAGIPGVIAKSILDESGFGDLKKANQYFKHFQSQMNNFEKQAEAMIQSVFYQITEEEMMEWNVSKFMRVTAKAEWILKNIMGYPIEFKDEQEKVSEETEPTEAPSYKELGIEMRKEGLDPMIEYAPYILKPKKFVETPFIAGTQHWKQVYK